jgi:S1-C subfamily serine protease
MEFFAFGFVLSLLFVAIGIWLGILFWPQRSADLPGLGGLTGITNARDAENQALQNRIDELRASLGGNICKLDPSKIAPLGIVNKHAAVPPASLPPQANNQSQTFSGNLAQLLDQATVMIIAVDAHDPHKLEEGSGFFIAPDTIMTNNHVIQHSESGKILVFDGRTNLPLRATLLAASGTSKIGAGDFAVLRVPVQQNVQPLALTSSVQQLQPVIAAGFPAAAEVQDRDFQALLQGNGLTRPPVILTDGRVSALQTSSSGINILPHTAQISQGNSGGPLADQCGRVVGIDTFGGGLPGESVTVNYALQATAAADFLQAHNVGVKVLSDPCSGALAPVATAAHTTPPTVPLVGPNGIGSKQ